MAKMTTISNMVSMQIYDGFRETPFMYILCIQRGD